MAGTVEIIKGLLEFMTYSFTFIECVRTYITVVNLKVHSRKTNILLLCLLIIIFFEIVYIIYIIPAFAGISFYIVNVLVYVFAVLFAISAIVISFILMERTVVLSDMVKYKKIFYVIHTIVITMPYISYSIIDLISGVQINFDLSKLYLNELFNKYDGIVGLIVEFTLTMNNLIGNYYLIRFYIKQGNLSNKRYAFLQSIIYSRMRFIIFGIFIDFLGIVMYILNCVGFIWAIPDGMSNFGIAIQCIVLIEFITYDIVITRFNVTYYDSEPDSTNTEAFNTTHRSSVITNQVTTNNQIITDDIKRII